MKVNTIFTKFKSKQIFEMVAQEFKDEDGNINLPNIDIIGDIYTEGKWDEEGNIIDEPVKLDGWHVNFSTTIPNTFRPYIIPRPSTPMRVFAGDDGLGE